MHDTTDPQSDTHNLSRNIHSLSRLLAHPYSNMPADVRQEKERELEGYIMDQQRQTKEARKRKVFSHPNVGRYHFVRFIERKKAEKNLKNLLKLQQNLLNEDMNTKKRVNAALKPTYQQAISGIEEEGGAPVSNAKEVIESKHLSKSARQRNVLDRKIHEAEIDINYTRYAPLEEKYISLFPGTSSKKGKKMEKDIEQGILANASGQKPPLWFEIERSMKDGTLEEMRAGLLQDRSGSGEESMQLVDLGGKILALERKAKGQPLKRKHSWMDDEIPPEDLDSDMSNGDGGFFE